MKKIITKRRGLFITLEGPEGCGKSTQAPLLVARLRGTGYEVVCVREPGGTATGEAIRHILQHHESGEAVCPEAELLLFLASRAQLVRQVIRPALNRGACVVCDRFADSTTAYQGYGRGLDVEQAIALNEFAVQGVMPDLTVLLDVDIGTGFRRLEKRNRERKVRRDRIERAARTFHERVRRGYL
ncbi:MAG: dTMP kinase, partial [Lentisphaerae bacterium]|nr:dTMP kinase [Lentisphaerota bacterium]